MKGNCRYVQISSAIFFGFRTSLQCICCIYFFLLLSLTAVRFQRAKRFPKTILVGRFLRRHSLYPGKSFSSSRVCCFGWIASPKERFDSSYQGVYIYGFYLTSTVFSYLPVLVFLQGFVTTVSHLRTFVPAIYDLTVAIPKTEEQPTMLRIFQRRSSVVCKQNIFSVSG